jgi:hypothetical protein
MRDMTEPVNIALEPREKATATTTINRPNKG